MEEPQHGAHVMFVAMMNFVNWKVHRHLMTKGFLLNYTVWIEHGEVAMDEDMDTDFDVDVDNDFPYDAGPCTCKMMFVWGWV